MNLILKSLLLPLLLVLTALPIHAEEDKWIDGIKFRYGTLNNDVAFKFGGFEPGFTIIEVNNTFSHLAATPMFPIAITLPETLMNSWSFRGAFLEYQPLTVAKDLVPFGGFEGNDVTVETTYLRQSSMMRTALYRDFFNASDKAFADANSNWALSADMTSSRIFLGYYWGVFLPYRPFLCESPCPWRAKFFKFGMGLGVYYVDLSYKLNLCSQYKVTPSVLDDGEVALDGHGGECVGKTEIDSASNTWGGVAWVSTGALYETVSKDTIIKIFVLEFANEFYWPADTPPSIGVLKLKNHSKNLEVSLEIESFELLSYTYRF